VIRMADEKKDPKVILADAIKKRDELNTFIKVLQEVIGNDALQIGVSDSATPSESVKVKTRGDIADPEMIVYPGMFFGKTQPEAVEVLLREIRRPIKTRVIAACLEKGGLPLKSKKPLVNLWGALRRNADTFILVPKAGW